MILDQQKGINMNIVGEHSNYIRNLIFTFTSVNSDDIRGIVLDGTLYFIVNFGILYSIDLNGFPKEITCCFQRSTDNPNSFKNEDMIIDDPLLFADICNKLQVISYSTRNPIYIDENCLDDSQIEDVQKLRSGDGSSKYYINSSLNHRSFVMISKQMIKMNKGDTLSVRAYDADNNRILYNFILYKKKFNLNINIFLLTCDLHNNWRN